MLRRTISAVCAILFALPAVPAGAGVLTVPGNVTEIGEEAFAGMTAVTDVSLPDTLTAVGDGAFSGCTSLSTIYIPDSVTAISDTAFSSCPEDMLVYTVTGSYAASWARQCPVDWDVGGVCRTLAIGQSYTGSSYFKQLNGPPGDAAAFSSFLQTWGRTAGSVTAATDLTGAQILTSVSACFADANEGDISIFYYGGHGKVYNGESVLVGTGGSSDFISASDLYGAFENVPGRVVMIIDACFSGGLLSRNADGGGSGASAFVQGFLAPFQSAGAGSGLLASRSALTTDRFFIMASSASDEESYEAKLYSQSSSGYIWTGLFSRFLMLGCGYDLVEGAPAAWAADSSGNGVISFLEAFDYARDRTADFVSEYGYSQNAGVWPEDSGWFGLFRY